MEEDTKNDEKPDFVDLLTNAGFKAVFGDEANQDVVMTIINEFLPEHRQVTEIQYLPTEHQGPVLSLNKEFQFDFMCRDASGVEFIVEAQSYIEEGWYHIPIRNYGRIVIFRNTLSGKSRPGICLPKR